MDDILTKSVTSNVDTTFSARNPIEITRNNRDSLFRFEMYFLSIAFLFP